ncbi:TetR/AcrR family transcriptional regulator [Compostimonas suwonensis]|uniref:AcrR family transcriptional regulator n=1 Tax=Compostimonas suwonensis TaxID=1048394 RepID=A0A2M9C4R8_9MICO|nr:TetR family transcriptional regulator [Compostimonas suwonensis]PJJ65524.1 AcrR family transcriptional regulator [Compostimonas suwonensis]
MDRAPAATPATGTPATRAPAATAAPHTAPTVVKRGRPASGDRARRRQIVLDAAVRLFLERGFEATTLDDIAMAAHVSKRTIYSYFGDKACIFTAAISALQDGLRASADHDSLQDVAAHVVHTLLSDDAIGLHRLIVAESVRSPALAADFYRNGPERTIALLHEHLGPHGDRGSRDRATAADTAASTSAATTTTATATATATAEQLYSLLLGEPHRRRLLGLDPAPGLPASRRRARQVLRLLDLDDSREDRADTTTKG